MFISVIIPTYNRSEMLGITIDSFIVQHYPKDQYEIIISNNNSTDNTAEVINEYLLNDLGVRIVYHFEKRQGVHYARNSAAKIAEGDILYFTDDDMIADSNLLEEIIKPFFIEVLHFPLHINCHVHTLNSIFHIIFAIWCSKKDI